MGERITDLSGQPSDSLTGLLRHRLTEQTSKDSQKTWAHLIVEALLNQAVKGDFRAIREILTRIDGDEAESESSAPLPIDDETARKILEAVNDTDDAQKDD